MLSLEPLLLERLAQVGEFRTVNPMADLDHLFDSGKALPAVFVVFSGYQALQGDDHVQDCGATQQVDTFWTVAVVVENRRDTTTGQAARADADVLIHQVLDLLMGWKPSKQHGHLYLAPAGQPQFMTGRVAVPLGFICRQTLFSSTNTD